MSEPEHAEHTEPEAAPAEDLTGYLGEDPFAAWPLPTTGAVIEDLPEEGVSVKHVEGEIDVPPGYAVIEGSPSGHRRSVAVVVSFVASIPGASSPARPGVDCIRLATTTGRLAWQEAEDLLRVAWERSERRRHPVRTGPVQCQAP